MRIVRIIDKAGYLALGMAAAMLTFCNGGSGAPSVPAFNPSDSLHLTGYMLGRDMGRSVLNIKETGAAFDNAMLLLALREALDGVPSRLSDSALRAVDDNLKRDIDVKRSEKRRQLDEESLMVASAFLEANKSKEGVNVTESGLQYVVLTQGTGKKPTLKDKVKVHYHGTLPDGTVFDSSVKRGLPATFAVEGVIPGWMEALQLMSVGSKYKVIVPPDLAYGRRGAGPTIGPNAVLIFEMELLEIEKSDNEKSVKGEVRERQVNNEKSGKEKQSVPAGTE
jgi:FKBP-type peptidyl-prolyl cis-trans isomerase